MAMFMSILRDREAKEAKLEEGEVEEGGDE